MHGVIGKGWRVRRLGAESAWGERGRVGEYEGLE